MSAYRETKVHGTMSFPYIVYIGIVPENIDSVQHHWHEEMEIIYVDEGSLLVSVGNNEYILGEHDMVLVHPHMIHSIHQNGDDTAVYYNILYRFSMLENEGEDICREKYFDPLNERKLIMPECITKGSELHGELEPLLKKLFDDPHHQRFHDELLIKSRVFEIMHVIIQHCDKADKFIVNEDMALRKLKRSLTYIEEHYDENITIEEMSRVSNYSESHFSKLFRQLTGDSFIQYLKNYRLDMASQRIRNEKTKISQIAFTCGFTNLSYFSRSFMDKFGMTPSQYRKLSIPVKR